MDTGYRVNEVQKNDGLEISDENIVHADQLTMEQMENIRSNIAEMQLLVGKEVGVTSLLEYYKNAHLPGFVLGIEYLAARYQMRQIRGDGNCFYRALWFGYLEALLRSYLSATTGEQRVLVTSELNRMIEKIRGSLQELVQLDYPEFALECFYDELLELLEALLTQSVESLETMFQEGGKADYLNWYMRILTAGYLKRNVDRFLPFVEGLFVDMDAYCKSEVEPVGKECEQLQILALTEYLEVQVEISYLDGRYSPETGVNKVFIPESPQKCPFPVSLLYRPGHYDLLYVL
jgi:ubiquitin thioesterase protein OTUB1